MRGCEEGDCFAKASLKAFNGVKMFKHTVSVCLWIETEEKMRQLYMYVKLMRKCNSEGMFVTPRSVEVVKT